MKTKIFTIASMIAAAAIFSPLAFGEPAAKDAGCCSKKDEAKPASCCPAKTVAKPTKDDGASQPTVKKAHACGMGSSSDSAHQGGHP